MHTPDVNWDVAHIFEHALLDQFDHFLAKNNVSPLLSGWLNGVTYKNVLYLEGGFYNKQAAQLCDEFIGNLPKYFREDCIKNAIQQVEAEEKEKITIKDEFMSQIHAMLHREWNSDTGHEPIAAHASPPLHKQAQASSFRDIIVSFGLANPTENEAKLFLRLSVIISDIIQKTLLDTYQGYKRQYHGPINGSNEHFSNFIAVVMEYTFARKQGTVNDIKSLIQQAIHNFPWKHHYTDIRRHFEIFNQEPLWQKFPIEYYEDTDVITNNAEIAGLATLDSIQQVASKVEVSVVPSTKDHVKALYQREK